ncbi:MAG: PAS domain-containing protein [Deltaproteobacteria bacterium]|nr:PAS domain-containing protein [Deltaproteobacteria bacterium]
MKITIKLRLAVWVPVFMAFIIGIALMVSYNVVRDSQEKDKVAQRIIRGMNELGIYISEYILFHDDRPLQQFLVEYDSISGLIGHIRFSDDEQMRILEGIRRDMDLMKGSFLKLVSNHERSVSEENIELTEAVENRLAGRLLVWSRDMVSHASMLERLVDVELTMTQRKINLLIFALIFFTSLFLTVVLTGIVRNITSSLNALREGTELIGAGDLDHRIDMATHDEIGDLSRSFDQMTRQLQEITVSKNKLQREIEERNKAEAALRTQTEKLRIVADFNYDWEYWVGTDNRFLWVSPSCERMTGYSREEFLDDPSLFLQILHSDDREHVLKHLHEEKYGQELREIEFRIHRRDGRECWIGHVCQVVTDDKGKLFGRRASNRDITERKKVEEELKHSRSELERRVKERTTELEKRTRELENFTFVAAHDLQEPLRKIRTFGDLLTQKAKNVLDDKSSEYIQRMRESAARMQALLHSLLEYSSLKADERPFKPIELKKSVEDALDNLETLIQEKGAQVEIHDLPVVEADHHQMTQLFQNLIHNALKFQPPCNVPHVKVHALATESIESPRRNMYDIYIEDNGIGFDDLKYLEKIFQPFQRLYGRDQFEGVGIGLSICKKIIEQHGGSLTAKSTSGKGSTFIITLPVTQAAVDMT